MLLAELIAHYELMLAQKETKTFDPPSENQLLNLLVALRCIEPDTDKLLKFTEYGTGGITFTLTSSDFKTLQNKQDEFFKILSYAHIIDINDEIENWPDDRMDSFNFSQIQSREFLVSNFGQERIESVEFFYPGE